MVSFPACDNHLRLLGWFIPLIFPARHRRALRAIIVVYGTRANRIDSPIGPLKLTEQLARHEVAVLAFDLDGSGASPRPRSRLAILSSAMCWAQ
jgi:hypothetical protein